MEVKITKDNFKSEVLDCKDTVIVDFFGTWCMPCKMLRPIVDKVSNELNIKLATIDVDENEELIKEFGIMSVPTLKIFKNGKEVASSVGVISETKLKEMLNN
ncbi:MAG: thioredoxin [Eubacteriales bacterium]|nr:thioredoxin [Eubacteriales bacterium]